MSLSVAVSLSSVTPSASQQVALTLHATGFDRVSGIAHAGDGSGRLFVVERDGLVWALDSGGQRGVDPYLDLTDRIGGPGMELGLLALAFAPDFEASRRLFVAYTDTADDVVISRFLEDAADPAHADPDSESPVLAIPQPTELHNVHHLAFGPDGYLYVASGDGGPAGDPLGNAQNLGVLLGKILRLDVDVATGYSIPPDNPFVAVPGARAEIWAYGLRNPADLTFDSDSGDLILTDVGQASWEEINRQPGTSGGGENYGWPFREGFECFNPPTGCPAAGFTPPVTVYPHTEGRCAVIGVGWSRLAPELSGRVVFGDFCTGGLSTARPGCLGWRQTEQAEVVGGLSAIGQDEAGEIYAAAWSTDGSGELWRLDGVTGTLFRDGFESGDLAEWSACRGGDAPSAEVSGRRRRSP